MKLKLYDKFNCWQEGGPIWLIGDTHFDDEDCKLINPHWPSPQEQINIINKCVGKNDTLIILGDVGDESFIKELKGYKVLITGNHDKGISKYIKKYLVVDENNELFCVRRSFEEAKEYMDEYDLDKNKQLYIKSNRMFDEVYDGPLFISDKILLSHESISIPFGINIHGHEHSGKTGINIQNNAIKYNAAANIIGWKPVRLDQCIEKISLNTIHRLTIDNATNKKNQTIKPDYYMEPLF